MYIVKKNYKGLVCAIVVIAALVASLTTAAILLINLCKKRRALDAYNDSFDCNMDDDYYLYDDCDCDCVEEAGQSEDLDKPSDN